ncbi:hypothetical protein PCE1_001877 [Barthelona sp. PCE]
MSTETSIFEQFDRLLSDQDNLQRQNGALRTKIQQLEEQIKFYEEKLEERDTNRMNNEEKMQELETKVRSSEFDSENSRKHIVSLQEENHELRTSNKTLEDILRTQKNEWCERLNNLNLQLNDYANQYHGSQLFRRIQDLEARNNELNQYIKDMNEETKNLNLCQACKIIINQHFGDE